MPEHRDGETMLSKDQAEDANRNSAGLMRTLVRAVEHQYQVQLTEPHALLPWLSTLFITRSKGITAFRRLRGRESTAETCETVLYKKQGSREMCRALAGASWALQRAMCGPAQ